MHKPVNSSAQTINGRASAPGKMVLLGEYVVLEGAPALVMAVDRHAYASFVAHTHRFWDIHAANLERRVRLVPSADGAWTCTDPQAPELRFVLEVFQQCFQQWDQQIPYGTLTLDTKDFFWNKHKLGLGSSAAITCACWQALRHASSLSSNTEDLQASWETLHRLHHAAQGGVGSGIDIAASLHGGILRYQRPLDGPAQIHRMPTNLGVDIVPIWSGHSASTAPRLQAFAQLKQDNPRLYWQLCEKLAVLAHAGTEFWSLQHKEAFLTVIDQYHDTLLELGQHMHAEIITHEHQQIAKLVRNCGAAYKSSGAGGGDLGIAVSPDTKTTAKLKKRLRTRGFQTLALSTAPKGLLWQPLPL